MDILKGEYAHDSICLRIENLVSLKGMPGTYACFKRPGFIVFSVKGNREKLVKRRNNLPGMDEKVGKVQGF